MGLSSDNSCSVLSVCLTTDGVPAVAAAVALEPLAAEGAVVAAVGAVTVAAESLLGNVKAVGLLF